MSAEVYSQRRDAVRGRALLATALLLVGVSILAALMVQSRGGQVLNQRTHPSGWEMSFRPPRGFGQMQSGFGSGGSELHFLGRTEEGGPVQLVVARVPEREQTPEAVAASISSDIAMQQFCNASLPGPEKEAGALGPVPGVQVKDLSCAVVARAARVSPSAVYLATMFAVDGRLDDAAYGRFEAVCQSFQRE